MKREQVLKIIEMRERGHSLGEISKAVFGDRNHRGPISYVLAGHNAANKSHVESHMEYVIEHKNNPWVIAGSGVAGAILGFILGLLALMVMALA